MSHINPTKYLQERGLECIKYFDGSDKRVIRKIDTKEEIGSYTGYEATRGGMRDCSVDIIFEEYIKPIVEAYEYTTTKETS